MMCRLHGQRLVGGSTGNEHTRARILRDGDASGKKERLSMVLCLKVGVG